jgi:hypothetical protein
MPKRISKKLKDSNQIASAVVSLATEEPTGLDRALLSHVMAEMGRKGGKIGGKRRLKTMTAKQRKSVARKAARARWRKQSS